MYLIITGSLLKGLVVGALATLLFLALFCATKKQLMPIWSFVLGLAASAGCYYFIEVSSWWAYAVAVLIAALGCTIWIISRGKLCSVDVIGDAIDQDLKKHRDGNRRAPREKRKKRD